MSFLLVDRILHLAPGGITRGVKHVSHDDVYLCRDDKERLCFMPSLVGEALGQLAAWNVMVSQAFRQRPVAGVVSRATLHRPVYVGETLLLTSTIDALDQSVVQYHSVAHVGHEVVFTIDSALGPLLPMEDFIGGEEIRRQFAEINRSSNEEGLQQTQRRIEPFVLPMKPSCIVPSMVFDGILDSEPGIRLTAQKSITRAASYFPDHFPNKPVLPMTVLLECKLNLAREFLARAGFETAYEIAALQKIKMNDFIHPGDVVVCHLTLKRRDVHELVLSYRSEVSGKRVCVLDVVMRAKSG